MTTIYHISDWHQRHDGFARMLDYEVKGAQLEEPDLLIITGDMVHNFSPYKRRVEDRGQYEGKRQIEHYHMLIDAILQLWPGVDIFGIRGNHDWFDYGIPGVVKGFDALEGNTYLWNGFKLHGFRGVPTFYGNWNDEFSERMLEVVASRTPEDTDILVTHVPPFGILDDANDYTEANHQGAQLWDQDVQPQPPILIPRNIGSVAVRDLVDRMPYLRAHFFGHVHEVGGKVEVRGNTVFSNASCTLNKVVL